MRVGEFLGEKYEKQSEHQQSYNNFNNDKLILLIKKFFLALNRPLSIADLGCGHGAATLDLLQKLTTEEILIKKFVGYDVSASQIEKANQLKTNSSAHTELSFVQQDIQTLSDKEQFDVLFSWFTLNWMEDINKARDKIYQALKPGGIFVHLTPLEKPWLFSARTALLKSAKWSEIFAQYDLKKFIAFNKSYQFNEQGYEDIFSEKFAVDLASSQRGRGIRIFQSNAEFVNFLKSWIPELRVEKNGKKILTENEKDEYVRELVESIKKLRYDQDADVNFLPDGRFEFHEEYVFACYHKLELTHQFSFWQQKTSDESVTIDESFAEQATLLYNP